MSNSEIVAYFHKAVSVIEVTRASIDALIASGEADDAYEAFLLAKDDDKNVVDEYLVDDEYSPLIP